jgi:hypothetical protein
VSDAEARAVIHYINNRLQTNCDSAAQFLFFSIAPICRAKPGLTMELLVHALRPLYYLSIGDLRGRGGLGAILSGERATLQGTFRCREVVAGGSPGRPRSAASGLF